MFLKNQRAPIKAPFLSHDVSTKNYKNDVGGKHVDPKDAADIFGFTVPS
ncbi:MAG: hypothetical protein HQL24_09515 [Candidatus Omnitrophica bacterium]|nr:hypothetical protein [Candidatus Omnitrophota bacterium]